MCVHLDYLYVNKIVNNILQKYIIIKDSYQKGHITITAGRPLLSTILTLLDSKGNWKL